jgi:hypothetical protein
VGGDAVLGTCEVSAVRDASFTLTAKTDKRGRCVGFELKSPRGGQSFEGEMGSGLISFDPQAGVVFFVQTHAEAKIEHRSVRKWVLDKTVGKALGVSFYRDGRVIAEYSMDELLVRPWLVTALPFGVDWITKLRHRGNVLVLETTSLRRVSFDTRTGTVVGSDDLPMWKQCDLLLYGAIQSDAAGLFFQNATVVKPSLSPVSPGGRLEIASRTAEGKSIDRRGSVRNLFCVMADGEGGNRGRRRVSHKYDAADFYYRPFNAVDAP